MGQRHCSARRCSLGSFRAVSNESPQAHRSCSVPATQHPACVTFPITTSKGCFLLTAPLCLPPHPSVSRPEVPAAHLTKPQNPSHTRTRDEQTKDGPGMLGKHRKLRRRHQTCPSYPHQNHLKPHFKNPSKALATIFSLKLASVRSSLHRRDAARYGLRHRHRLPWQHSASSHRSRQKRREIN